MTVVAGGRVTLRVGRAELVDAGMLVVLSLTALVGFRTTYTGWAFLAVGVVGVALGIAIGQVATALRQPMITVAALTVVVFFLLGGAIALRAQTVAGVLPTAGTLHALADVSVHGWKDLLTVLPPVDGAGSLLVIPYLLGLACGAGGFTVASRFAHPAAPLGAPVLLLVAVILLGTDQPAARLVQGGGFAAAALVWVAMRENRRRPVTRSGGTRTARLATGVAVVLVATVFGAGLGPVLFGGGHQRTVLRNYVTPPFDIGAYPSPLVGFRKYTKDADLLWNQPLLRVTGLPAGWPIRIATLDDYDGSVWGATSGTLPTLPGAPRDEYQRVGSHIPPTEPGQQVTVRVVIDPAYAAATDLDAWVPDAGAVASVEFTGPDAAGHADGFRYDLATSSGVVADRLRAGDTYTESTVLTRGVLPPAAPPDGVPSLSPSSYTFVASRAVQWSDRAGSATAQVLAVGRHLRDSGAYSDGGPGETQYLPGHSTGRLTAFVNAQQPVGDDEQYAAAFALMANDLGMPARVVLGAVPEQDGVVRGRDVHAWVEIRPAGGLWVTVPRADFMPDTSKKPNQQPPQQQQDKAAAVVPPPNPVRPPSTTDLTGQVDPTANHGPRHGDGTGLHLPAFLIPLVTWGGPPLLAVVLLCGAVVGWKARRRHRRRTVGSGATRMATGWHEVVDRGRDLGVELPLGRTRQEEASLLAAHPVAHLARTADAGVFGPGEPAEWDVQSFWAAVDATLVAMVSGLGRWRRLRVALSPRSLLPRRTLHQVRGALR